MAFQQYGPGHYFVDFGKEFQGGLTLSFANAPGGNQSCYVRMGEELSVPVPTNSSQPPPAVMYKMRTGNNYEGLWTLRQGDQVIEHHEYAEFR